MHSAEQSQNDDKDSENDNQKTKHGLTNVPLAKCHFCENGFSIPCNRTDDVVEKVHWWSSVCCGYYVNSCEDCYKYLCDKCSYDSHMAKNTLTTCEFSCKGHDNWCKVK